MQLRIGTDILWSPTREDQFVEYDSDIYLYKTLAVKKASLGII